MVNTITIEYDDGRTDRFERGPRKGDSWQVRRGDHGGSYTQTTAEVLKACAWALLSPRD